MTNRHSIMFFNKLLMAATLLFMAPAAFALIPVLHFSDINSGPKVGLGDGKGSGAIVTIWGNNLGDMQMDSKVYIGGEEAAYVYSWARADGTNANGPADLYTYHKIQAISFSIPATVADGENDIHVTVGGMDSNTLPFVVRDGNIFFVSPNGSNADDGSWNNPWQTLNHVGSGAKSGAERKFQPGDITYATDGVIQVNPNGGGLTIMKLKGTAERPYVIAAYPGATVLVKDHTSRGIHNFNYDSAYWHFSKLNIQTNGNGISTFKGLRAIGNTITNYPGGCATGQGGAISGNNLSGRDTVGGGIKVYGNHIYDFGCDTSSKLHHVFYISNRGGSKVKSFELGWNYLHDNKVHHALHVYDERSCGDFEGPMKIHNNVVINQVGGGVNIATGGTPDPCLSMDIEIYNNLMVNTGLDIPKFDGYHFFAIRVVNRNNRSNIKIINNTIDGYGEPGKNGYALHIQGQDSPNWIFGGTWEFKNNIIVDTNDLPYQSGVWKEPDIAGGNLWFNGGDGTPSAVPSWSTSNFSNVDPLMNNLGVISKISPANNSGVASSLSISHDLAGVPRGGVGEISIGAYEYNGAAKAPPSATQLMIIDE
ncbi:hypothetical protein MNBD_GAMMA03-1818 [hydrothermal vent metagenome]|uniref:Uncharacterized protein n=1 Tax=hydrothermal vent metagenome TaxID=652676 RepID=A0A3B0VXM3_9ZZZZ